ncbi:MAG: flagellar protein FlaG [Desulfomicrobium sp.]|nr:flagellar protein FlaG [Desulfomicrobium sp.]NLV95974.1 flagellar protein FlaG [Desulfovibrionales bacterium]
MKIASLVPESSDTMLQLENVDQHRAYVDKIFPVFPGQDVPALNTGNQHATTSLSLQKLNNMTDAVENYLGSLGVNLKFNIDEQTDIIQVEVRDPKTDKLIRKIPADEMLALAVSIEQMVGLFLNKVM